MKAEVAAFLAELTALSRKHELVVGACGCCFSPFICKGETVVADRLSWSEKDGYVVGED